MPPVPDLSLPVQRVLNGEARLDEVAQALEDGADPNEWEASSSPLRAAIQANHSQLLRLLVDSGANVNATDDRGVGPLHMAVFQGLDECAQLLLEAGADANILDRHGQSPLFFAPTPRLCELLVRGQADINVRNAKDQSALHLAAHAGLVDIVKWFLVNNSLLVGQKDKKGRTPLMYATKSRTKMAVPVLETLPSVLPAEFSLDVRIVGAKGVQASEWFSKADPYCICELNGKSALQTQVVANTANPVWNHTAQIHACKPGDCLVFKLLEKDSMHDDILGTATLDVNSCYLSGFRGDLQIQRDSKLLDTYLQLDIAPLSSIAPVASPVPEAAPPAAVTRDIDVSWAAGVDAQEPEQDLDEVSEMPLDILIVGAKGLKNSEWFGKSDPFCICHISDQPVLRTDVVSNSLSPSWERSARVENYRPGDPLVFKVFDHDSVQNDLMGIGTITAPSFFPSGFKGDIPLERNGELDQGFLTVDIAPVRASMAAFVPTERIRLQPLKTDVAEEKVDHAEKAVGDLDKQVQVESKPTPLKVELPLNVVVVGAKSLRAADWIPGGGSSDPYCVCQIDGRQVLETQIVRNNVNPVWDHSARVVDYKPGDRLVFSVYDKDVSSMREDLLGTAALDTNSFYPAGFEGDVLLEGDGRAVEAYLTLRISPVQGQESQEVLDPPAAGEVPAVEEATPAAPSLSPADASRALHLDRDSAATAVVSDPSEAIPDVLDLGIAIVGAKDLKSSEWFGKSDPYCICEVNGECRLKTEVVSNSLNPVWNLKSQLQALKPADSLVFKVYDKDLMKDDLLGTVTLPCQSLWPSGFEGDVPLENDGKGVDAYLTLSIAPAPSMPASQAAAAPEVNETTPVASVSAVPVPVPMVSAEVPDMDLAASIPEAAMPTPQVAATAVTADKPLTGDFKVVRQEASTLPAAPGAAVPEFAGEASPGLDVTVAGQQAVEEVGVDMDLHSRAPREGALDLELLQPEWEATREEAGVASAAGEALTGAAAVEGVQTEALMEQEALPTEVPLSIAIIGAKDLESSDWIGKADAYCVCNVNGKSELQTKVASNNRNPTWNFKTEFPNYRLGRPLAFTVYDDDMFKDGTLGTATLRSEDFYPSGFHGDVPLEINGQDTGSRLTVNISPILPSTVATPKSRGVLIIERQSTDETRRELELEEEARIAQKAEEARQLEEQVARLREEARQAEAARKAADEARAAAEARAVDAAKAAEEAKLAEQALAADQEQALQEAKQAEERRIEEEQLATRLREEEEGADMEIKRQMTLEDKKAVSAVVAAVHRTAAEILLSREPARQAIPDVLDLDVSVVGAKGLKSSEWFGKSDPYCVCEVNGVCKLKTEVISNSLNPVWNLKSQVQGLRPTDVLVFKVYDKDLMKDDLLGMVTLPCRSLWPSGFEGDVPLENDGKHADGYLTLSIAPAPSRMQAASLDPEMKESIALAARAPVIAPVPVPLVSAEVPEAELAASVPAAPTSVPQVAATPITTDVPSAGDFPVAEQEAAHHNEEEIPLNKEPTFQVQIDPQIDTQIDRQIDSQIDSQMDMQSDGDVQTSMPAEVTPELSLGVDVLGARGLRNAEWFGKSDPYCVCELKGVEVLKTATISNNLNPAWNHSTQISKYRPGEVLVFKVFDKDANADDLLGTAILESDVFFPLGFEGSVPLQNNDGKSTDAYLDLKISAALVDHARAALTEHKAEELSVAPENEVALDGGLWTDEDVAESSEEELVLDVMVIGATGLRNTEWFSKSDPYCVCEINEERLLQTEVISNNLNPVWNHRTQINDYRRGDTLVFTVFEKDDSQDTPLGSATLESHVFYPTGFEGKLALKDPGSRASEAFLHVKIEQLRSAEPVALAAAQGRARATLESALPESDEEEPIYEEAETGQIDLAASRERARAAFEDVVLPDDDAETGAKEDEVQLFMKVENVDYPALVSRPTLLSMFSGSVKEIIADAAGKDVQPEDVALELSAGSVIVQAKIRSTDMASAKLTESNLLSSLLFEAADAKLGSMDQLAAVCRSGQPLVSSLQVNGIDIPRRPTGWELSRESAPEPQEEEVPTQQEVVELSAAEAKRRLAASLGSASRNGRLVGELREHEREQDVQTKSEAQALVDLKRRARENVTSAAVDGSLTSALMDKEVIQPQPQEKDHSELEIRRLCRANLSSAVQDGRFKEALKLKRTDSEEELEAVLQAQKASAASKKPERTEEEKARRRAKQGLKQALFNGSLKAFVTPEVEAREEEVPLNVAVVGARDLPNTEWFGHSDPYCTCSVNEKIVFQTEVVANNTDPLWSRGTRIIDYRPGDSLEFKVYNKNQSKDDLLGSTTLRSEEFYPAGFDKELPLTSGGKSTGAMLTLKVAALPTEPVDLAATNEKIRAALEEVLREDEQVAAAPAPQTEEVGLDDTNSKVKAALEAALVDDEGEEQEVKAEQKHERNTEAASPRTVEEQSPVEEKFPLHIGVIGANNLRNAEWFGKSDPYCVCELRGEPIFQTDVVASSLNPEWNHNCKIPDYVLGEPLVFKVYDKDTCKDDLLGTAIVNSNWFHPSGFEGEVALEDGGKLGKAHLVLKIAGASLADETGVDEKASTITGAELAAAATVSSAAAGAAALQVSGGEADVGTAGPEEREAISSTVPAGPEVREPHPTDEQPVVPMASDATYSTLRDGASATEEGMGGSLGGSVKPSLGLAPSRSESFSSESEVSRSETIRREERDGCLFWDVILKKDNVNDKFGFAQVNGRAEFEVRLPAPTPSAMNPDSYMPDSNWRGPEVLVVRRIHEGGLLHRWCTRHPEAEVLPQDRVWAVNNETTVDGMQREIRERRIQLRFMRYPEHFVVKLKKSGDRLGFRIQPSSPQELRVTEILSAGALQTYNRDQIVSGRWHFAVLPDMVIESTNSIAGDATAMAEELKSCEEVSMRIRRNEHVLFSPQQARQKLHMLSKFGMPFSQQFSPLAGAASAASSGGRGGLLERSGGSKTSEALPPS